MTEKTGPSFAGANQEQLARAWAKGLSPQCDGCPNLWVGRTCGCFSCLSGARFGMDECTRKGWSDTSTEDNYMEGRP